ncbi:MAG: hypothetical protein U9O98_01980, partial [Asgard group archaeon]|nr:hypothetical protein [Asgard group archaeon]
TEISANEYEEVKNLPNQFEQYAFFDSLNYEEGKKAYGQVIADKKGNIYFILRNNHNEPIIVIIELTYRTTIQPWLLGLIIATITVVVLLIGLIIAVKLRQKMLEESKEETELSPQQKYWET